MSHRIDEGVTIFGVQRRTIPRPTKAFNGHVSFFLVRAGAGAAQEARRLAREHGLPIGRRYMCREYTRAEYEAALQGAGEGNG